MTLLTRHLEPATPEETLAPMDVTPKVTTSQAPQPRREAIVRRTDTEGTVCAKLTKEVAYVRPSKKAGGGYVVPNAAISQPW